MDVHHAFEILEIEENASLPEITKAYRDLTQVWHPDLYVDKPRLYAKALEKMKEINAAYDCILSFLEHKAKPSEDTHTAPPAQDEYGFLGCPNCRTKNRVPKGYSTNIKIRCGKCGFLIHGGDSESGETDWSQRTLCGDGNCTGVIGSNGKCSVCGKTYSEGKRADEHKANLRNEEYQNYIRKEKKRKIRRYSLLGLGILVFIVLVFVFDRWGNIKPDKSEPPTLTPTNTFKVFDRQSSLDEFFKNLESKPGPLISEPLPSIPEQPLPESGEVISFTEKERIAPFNTCSRCSRIFASLRLRFGLEHSVVGV